MPPPHWDPLSTVVNIHFHKSAIADHVNATGHNILMWGHFEILVSGKSDYDCKITKHLFLQDLKPAFNVNISGEKLRLY